MKKVILGLLLFTTSFVATADNIGLGKVAAIKEYDFNSLSAVKIYLEASATVKNSNCQESGKTYGFITLSKHDSNTVNRMVSMATAAYFSGKKIRIFSESNTCEIDFLALQENEF